MTVSCEKHPPVDLVQLKTALDDCSDKNRNFMIAFLVLALFFLITVLNTTDRDLFLPNSLLQLPFVGIDISLLGFYLLAPVLLVAFHYNLLFNLLEHSRTLKEWLDHPDNNRTANFNLLHAFVLNTRAKYDNYETVDNNKLQKRSINYHLLNIIIIGLMSVFPLYLLVLILWKFASYQSYAITLWHTLWIGICLFLHIVYWLRIQYPRLLNSEYDSFRKLLINLKDCRIESFYLAVAVALVTIRILGLSSTHFSSVIQPLMSSSPVKWAVPHIDVSGNEFRSLSQQAMNRSSLRREEANQKELEASELNSKPSKPLTLKAAAVQAWEQQCQDKSAYMSTELVGRSLRLANLSRVILCNVNLTDADLRGANLNNAIIAGTLANADLSGLSMQNTKIQRGTQMTAVTLNDADLTFAVLNEVNLILAKAKNVRFFATQLTDASMVQSDLSSARFTRTQLLRTNLRGANLLDTTFEHTELTGTDLRFVRSLRGVNQLVESTISYCLVDARVVLRLEAHFEKANCDIKHNIEPQIASDFDNEWRIEGFSFNKDKFNQIRNKSESTNDLVNSIIAITQSDKQTSIDLSGNNLTLIPSSLLTFSHLKEINLSYNRLTVSQISLLVKNIPGIRVLNIRNNQLTTLPDNIGQLTQLTTLDLSFNKLTKLPDTIGQLTQLTKLNLGDHQLTAVPDSIGQLTKLTELDLSHNTTSTIFLLLLGKNPDTSRPHTILPDSIGQLTQLTTLDLSFNKLTKLPKTIGQLTQLTELKSIGNTLAEVPDSIGELIKLTRLYLMDNQLTELPDSIGQLTKLTALYLSDNKLTTVPDSIGQLKNLITLNLNGNPLTGALDTVDQSTDLKK